MSVEALSWALNLTRLPDGSPLRPTVKLVLLGIANHADIDGGNSYPKHSTLARYAVVDVRNVRRALHELRAAGVISWTVKTGGSRTQAADTRPNTYTIHMRPATPDRRPVVLDDRADTPSREWAEAPGHEWAEASTRGVDDRTLAPGREWAPASATEWALAPGQEPSLEPSLEPSAPSPSDIVQEGAHETDDDDGDDASISATRENTIRAALRLIAQREADRRTDIGSRTAWTTKRIETLHDAHHDRARALLTADPTLVAKDLADALEGTQRMRTRPTHVA